MQSYSLGVALFDYVPTAVTTGGLALLSHAIARRHHSLALIAWSATLLIFLGGTCKASWKLIIALQQIDIAWLESLLFIFLTPGFVAMSFSLFHARRAWQVNQPSTEAHYPLSRLLLWLAIPLAGALALAILHPATRQWFFWLLGFTTLANACLIANAIIAARHCGLGWPTVACFIYNFAATLALGGLARLSAGEATAWIQEGVNFSAQLALALGCWQLSNRMKENT